MGVWALSEVVEDLSPSPIPQESQYRYGLNPIIHIYDRVSTIASLTLSSKQNPTAPFL